MAFFFFHCQLGLRGSARARGATDQIAGGATEAARRARRARQSSTSSIAFRRSRTSRAGAMRSMQRRSGRASSIPADLGEPRAWRRARRSIRRRRAEELVAYRCRRVLCRAPAPGSHRRRGLQLGLQPLLRAGMSRRPTPSSSPSVCRATVHPAALLPSARRTARQLDRAYRSIHRALRRFRSPNRRRGRPFTVAPIPHRRDSRRTEPPARQRGSPSRLSSPPTFAHPLLDLHARRDQRERRCRILGGPLLGIP